jgi:protein ImuB
MPHMSSSRRRYLSIWLRRLATDRIMRAAPNPADAPLVVTTEVKSALRLAATNDAAAALGLRPGMALADARAMYPGLMARDADRQADRRLLEAIADWCDRYTPLVGLDVPDGLVLDITGCTHLFGGETALCRDIVARLARQNLRARVAVADTVGCAFAVARHGNISVVAPEETRAVLLPLPIAALRIAPEIESELADVGLKRIADVIERPRAPLAARFGTSFLRRLDQAVGREDEPITPRMPLPAVIAERRFADPIALEADVLGTIEQLARELGGALERRGEGARLLQVALFRTDGKVHRMEIGTAAPVRESERVRRLFAERLATLGDACDPGFGFDMVRLSALVTERQDPIQTGLAAPDHEAELAHLIDRFGARFGLRRIVRLDPHDSHIPECAVVATPAHAVKTGWGTNTTLMEADQEEIPDSLAPIRPIRLLQRPEPIEATAEVPDGPPVQFTWRRVNYVVAHAEGPERIAMEWWRDPEGHTLTRDYFRVESRAGVRVWLFREGFFQGSTPPRWYLHGLFA